MPDRHALGFVFQDFDAHAVRRFDEGLIQPVVVARQHGNPGGLPFGHLLLDVFHDEPDVVHRRIQLKLA